MNARLRTVFCAGLMVLFAGVAQGEIITYDISQHAAYTLKSLGTKFVLGCVAIAVGIVVAAVIKRKK